jgi:hypothetical protein
MVVGTLGILRSRAERAPHRPRDQRQPQGTHRAPDRRHLHPSLGGRRRRRLSPLPLRRDQPEEQRDRFLDEHHLLLQPQPRPHWRAARRLRQRQDREPTTNSRPSSVARRSPSIPSSPVPPIASACARRPPSAPSSSAAQPSASSTATSMTISAADLGLWPSTSARPAFSLGGSLDLNLYPNLAFRITPSYTATTFGGSVENNAGFEMGVVYRFGRQK